MDITHTKSFVRDLFLKENQIAKTAAVLFFIVIAALSYISIETETGLYFLAGFLGLPIIVLCMFYPKLWIYSIAISSAAFFRSSSEGLSAIDVLVGAYYIGGLLLWLFLQLAVFKRKIVRNTADWFILFFFIFVLFNLIISVLNDVEIIDAIREYSLFILVLYYFPIREYFTDRKSLTRLLLIFMLTVFALDINQFYDYYKAAFTDLTYAYQLGTSVRINQTILTSASVFGLIFALHIKKKLFHILMILFTAATVSALITTFSRAFWLILLLNVILVFFYLPIGKKLKLGIYSIVISGVLFLVAMFVFKDNMNIIFTVIEKKLVSSVEGKRDISVLSRLYEYEEVVSKIKDNPLGGNGFAKEFVFYNPITDSTTRTNFTHNGYLFLSYRFGIPMAICFLIPLFIYLAKSHFLILSTKENSFYRLILIGSMASLLLVVISNFITSTFLMRDGTFVIALSYALIGISEQKLAEKKSN